MASDSPDDDANAGLVARSGDGDNAQPYSISEISSLLKRTVELVHKHYRDVPVLVIASSSEEFGLLHKAIKDGGKVPAEEVQRFSEFDEDGGLLMEFPEFCTMMLF